ncbi:MAG: 2-oxoacid:acceptor oxidoreductase family protein [Marinifilaceae bacterium]
MHNLEIKLGGFGGQGIILAGYIIGKAASLYDQKNATLTQSYGPESRGGACNAQIIVSNEEVDYPMVLHPNILIILSKEAYDKYIASLAKKGILFFDEDLVENHFNLDPSIQAWSVPATRMAEEMGRKIVANIIMLGFFTAISGTISPESMEKAIETSVPKGTQELNLKAFTKGFEYGKEKFKIGSNTGFKIV